MGNSYSAFRVSAMVADQNSTVSMPCCPTSMPAMYMGMAAAASATAAYITLLRTGVLTSVSLFVVVVGIIIGLLLLVGLVVLISLILTGLTGLVGLESLVGQNEELATNATQGD